jgi:hypothetical protein
MAYPKLSNQRNQEYGISFSYSRKLPIAARGGSTAATEGRIEQLPCQTISNAEDIAWERAVFAATRKELRRLDAWLFMI